MNQLFCTLALLIIIVYSCGGSTYYCAVNVYNWHGYEILSTTALLPLLPKLQLVMPLHAHGMWEGSYEN